MWNFRLFSHGTFRALAITVAGAGIFAGCGVTKTVQNATSGTDPSTNPTRNLTFSDAPSIDLGTVAVGTTQLVRLSVVTTGTGSATIGSTSNSDSHFTFNGGTFPGNGGDCAQPIQRNCTVAVLFTASAVGIYSNVVSIGYTTAGVASSTNVTVSASATIAPALVINGGAPYSFGTKSVASSTDATLTIQNAGGLGASSIALSGLSAPITFKGGSYPGTGGTCANFLASGGSCTIVLTYAPVAAGTATKTLTASYSDGTTTYSSNDTVNGTAVTLASLAVTTPAANPYDYGNVTVGMPTDATFTVTNSGGQSATSLVASGLSAPIVFKGGTYPGTGGNCGTTLAAGATCTFVATFTPTAAGLVSKTADIAYADGSGSTVHLTKNIQGTGITPAVLAISNGPTYDYGPRIIGSSTDATFTVTNSGGSTSTAMVGSGLAAPFTFKGGTYPGTGGTCGATLAAAATCNLVITFSPTASTVSNATLSLAYNDGANAQSATRAVTGTGGTAATLTLNGNATYAFGSKSIGSSTDATITIANAGTLGATTIALSGLSAPMTFKGGTYPGTGGTCGATLAASSGCTIVVTYAPTAAVVTSETLTVGYNNPTSPASTSQLVTGTGLALASLTILTPASSPYDYGGVTIGKATDVTLTISNGGGQSATALAGSGLGAPMVFKGGTFPGTGGNCGATLAAAATCTIVVTYTPTAAVLTSEIFSLAYADGSGSTPTLTRGIQGTGITAAVLVISNGATYDFGTHPVGSSTDVTLTVTSTGSSTATGLSTSGIAAPMTFKGGTYPGTGGSCAATLASAASCTMVLTYAPTAAVVTNKTLSLAYNDGANAQNATRALTGTGQSIATLSLNAGAPYAYGSKNVGTSNDATLTIANSGGYSASAIALSGLAAPMSFKDGSYPGTGGTCGATLAGGASCTIVVTYAPTSSGAVSKTLVVGYNNGNTTTSTSQSITGTGIGYASLSVTNPVADPYDFGTATIGNPEVDVTFTLSNSGGQTAASLTSNGLFAPFNFMGGAYPGTGGTCGATLAAGSTCTLVLSFLPTSPGTYTATLDIGYDDGSGTIVHLTHAVRGTGGNAALLAISDGSTYDFGSHAPSTTTDYTFTVTNSGGSSATTIAASALSAPFSFKGGTYPGTGGTCGATLGGAATCTMVVTFAPTASGGYTDTITLGYSNGVSTVNASRGISGTGGTVANLTISDGATFDFGAVVESYSATKAFTVTNVGGSGASVMSGSALSAPYSYLGGAYPGTGGSCGNSLGAGGTCTVLVKFTPTSTTTSNSTFTLNYYNTVSTTTSNRGITGTGATISAIAGGANHTCALYSTGIVKCWGSNGYGQLGNTSNTDSSLPVPVTGLAGASGLASGANHTCALTGGKVYCWGRDNNGQIGDNAALTDVNAPAQVALYTDFTQIAAGGDVSCGLRSGGTIVCWGDDSEGANGNDSSFVNNATPVTVSGLTTMTSVAVGRGHACGSRSTGSFRCWGSDTFGQIGDGGGANVPTPYNPGLSSSATAVAGGDVSCDVATNGTVKCWGADDYGQLGNGAPNASQSTPVTITNLASESAIKFGLKHGCALTAGGAVMCWGRDTYGQVGDNAALADQSAPVTVSGMSSTSVIGVGENHSCGAQSTGLVYCWGLNSSSQLGDGSTTNQPTPILVQGL
jgi:alpha-tubulin suppressor-like RCC1 family protein